MPAPYAHMKTSDLAITRFISSDKVVPELRSYAEKFSRYIHLGSVAPDYPYFDVTDGDQKNWADHMHYDHTGDFLKTMAEKLVQKHVSGVSREEFFIPFCWTLGYISHVTADLVVHPIVKHIVGEYAGHEKEHKECEMVQDSYIFNKLTGRDIEESRLIEELENFSDPEDDDDISPIIKEFWNELFQKYFPGEFIITPPKIHTWHDEFTSLLKEQGILQKFGRAFGVSYKKFSETRGVNISYYIDRIKSPFGTACTYDQVFDKAVNSVSERWESLALAMEGGNPELFISEIRNYNLDTGEDEQKKLVFWKEPGATEFA